MTEATPSSPVRHCWVGGHRSAGISTHATDGLTPDWEQRGHLAADNATYLALSASGDRLYASHSARSHLSAYGIDRGSGALHLLGTAATETTNPAHLAIAPDGRTVLAASFTSGHVTGHRLAEDGTLGELIIHRATEGTLGPDRAQTSSQPHQISFGPDGSTVAVPDRGTDLVHLFSFDGRDLTKLPPAAAPAGSGPRHLAWHPRLPLAYLIGELDSTMISYRWVARERRLDPLEAVSLRPAGGEGTNSAAAVMITPDGRQLFGTNRGDDTICRFVLGPDGRLDPAARTWWPAGGRTPRFAGLDPSGTRLWCAAQDSDVITGYDISGPDPILIGTVDHPSPTCVVFG